jgi:hypothetical protein
LDDLREPHLFEVNHRRTIVLSANVRNGSKADAAVLGGKLPLER